MIKALIIAQREQGNLDKLRKVPYYPLGELLLQFCRDYKEGKVEIPKALTAIRFLEEHRQLQRSKLKYVDKDEIQKQMARGNNSFIDDLNAS